METSFAMAVCHAGLFSSMGDYHDDAFVRWNLYEEALPIFSRQSIIGDCLAVAIVM